jgi:hypothetical protein
LRADKWIGIHLLGALRIGASKWTGSRFAAATLAGRIVTLL